MVRFTDAEVAEIGFAGKASGSDSVAKWSRERLLDAARRARS
jgi:hypothetical protein